MEDINKIYFSYERLAPYKWPEPRDIRQQLQIAMCKKYKDCKISSILLSTEIVLKKITFKCSNGLNKEDEEKILLLYKVINIDWEILRTLKEVEFHSKMFRWISEDNEY